MRHIGFSVLVNHRQRRLTLKRFLPSVDAAASFVRELQRNRFHARDAIFVIDESTGQIVSLPEDLVTLPTSAASSAPPPSLSLEANAALTLASVDDALEETTRALHRLVRLRRDLRRLAGELRRQADGAQSSRRSA